MPIASVSVPLIRLNGIIQRRVTRLDHEPVWMARHRLLSPGWMPNLHGAEYVITITWLNGSMTFGAATDCDWRKMTEDEPGWLPDRWAFEATGWRVLETTPSPRSGR